MTLETGWNIRELESVDGVPTWQLDTTDTIARSQGDDLELTAKVLGHVNEQVRFMAITRIEPFWIGCEHDKSHFYLSNDGVLLSFLNTAGQCITLFAFNGTDDFYTVFRTGSNGSIEVAGRNDTPIAQPLRILAAISNDKQASIAAVMSQARQIASQTPKLQALISTALAQGTKNPDPAFFDNFGFCTWNAIGQDLTREKLLDGLAQLAKHNIRFDTLLIDDNWQTLGPAALDYSNPGFRGWTRFEANSSFPGGLAITIKDIKSLYPHIQYIGVWHALLGYWGGLATDHEFSPTYNIRKTHAKLRMNTPAEVLIIDPSSIHQFYDDFYAFLKSCGIDFVKTDVQHMLGLFASSKDREEVPSAYQSAWTAAYLKHFDGQAISCMSQIPQISFHSFLQDKTPKVLLRNSDDFFPEIPRSHPFHLFINAHNALVTQHLNCVPDWDMFQTSHPYSSYHGAARAISGGPVLITDTPGEHDVGLVNEMTALSPEGRRVAVRPTRMAVAADTWDSFESGRVLKVRAGCEAGAGILGCFNTAEGQVEEMLGVWEVLGRKCGKGEMVVRSYRTGQVFVPETEVQGLVKVKLETRGWDVLSAFPFVDVGGKKVAVLGLVDKISGAAAVAEVHVDDGGLVVKLKALGRFAIFVRGAKTCSVVVTVDGEHEIASDQVRYEDTAGGKMCSVDLEAFWSRKGPSRTGTKTLEVRIQL